MALQSNTSTGFYYNRNYIDLSLWLTNQSHHQLGNLIHIWSNKPLKKTIASGKCKRTTAQSQNLIRNLQLCSKTRVNKSTTPSKGHATQPRNLWIKFTELPKTQSLDKLKKNVRSSSSSTIYDIQMKNQSPVVLSTHLNGQPLLLLPIVLWGRNVLLLLHEWISSFFSHSTNSPWISDICCV